MAKGKGKNLRRIWEEKSLLFFPIYLCVLCDLCGENLGVGFWEK